MWDTRAEGAVLVLLLLFLPFIVLLLVIRTGIGVNRLHGATHMTKTQVEERRWTRLNKDKRVTKSTCNVTDAHAPEEVHFTGCWLSFIVSVAKSSPISTSPSEQTMV